VALQRTRVHLGDDEWHFRVEPEVAAVIDDDGATRDGLIGELDSGPLLAFRTGEEGDVHAIESLRLGHPYLERLPCEDRGPRAPGQDAQLS
jgi:hypothetical protein